jgi:hypothetical protein
MQKLIINSKKKNKLKIKKMQTYWQEKRDEQGRHESDGDENTNGKESLIEHGEHRLGE